MIKISKIEQLLKNLEDLEKDLEAGKIPKKQYISLKKQYTNRLDTLQAAERIKRMQGRSTSENTLDHWASKSKIEKDEEEQEELIKKYVTTPKPTRSKAKAKAATSASSSKGGISRIGIIAGVLLALAFFVGTGFGVMMLNAPVTADNGTVTVNQTAFPLIENLTTNTTSSNHTSTNTTKSNKTHSGSSNNTPTPTPTPTPDPTPTPGRNSSSTG